MLKFGTILSNKLQKKLFKNQTFYKCIRHHNKMKFAENYI